MFAPVLVTPPAETPVSLTEAKAHLRVDHTDYDTVITMQIDAATEYLDGYTGILGRGLVTQTWEQEFSTFQTCMRLPLAPASAVSSITYTDSAGDAQTLASSEYELLTDGKGPYVSIETLPSTDDGRIKITFVVGYGAASAVPATIKAAILLHIGSLYEMREREIVGASLAESDTYKALIAPYKRLKL